MWNRVEGPKGFDTDAALPYRERLIIAYVYTETKSLAKVIRTNKGIGEAYVDGGEWYWWDNTGTNCKVKVQPSYKIKAWTIFPHGLIPDKTDF